MKRGKLPKMNKACSTDELRPVMNHVYIDENNIVATNASILVVHNTREVLNEQITNELKNTGPILLHRKKWEFFTRLHSSILLKDGFFEIIYDYDYSVHLKYVEEETYSQRFPNWPKVIPDFNKLVGLNEIGLSLKLLNDVSEALGISSTSQSKLTFKAKDRAVKIEPLYSDYPNSWAIIMPVNF